MAKVVQKFASLGTKLAGSVAKGPVAVKGVTDFAAPRLKTFMKYARVELKPPSPSEFGEVQLAFKNLIVSAKSGKYLQLTVKESALNTLIFIEIMMWFYVGEIIGRRNFIGYYLPGAVHYDPVI